MAIDEPSTPVPSLDIPVIDISGYLAGDIKATKSIVSQLNAAAQAPGFLQIIGHNITANLRETLLGRIAAFFALPAESKNALHRKNSKALRGFETLGEQQLEPGFADVKEGFMIGTDVDSKDARFLQGPNQWPAAGQVDGFESVFMEYFQEMRDLSKVMFRLMALSLSLDEFFFDKFAPGQDCRCCLYRLTIDTSDDGSYRNVSGTQIPTSLSRGCSQVSWNRCPYRFWGFDFAVTR
jgi:isopenicillin N synthase-like dioxygenase